MTRDVTMDPAPPDPGDTVLLDGAPALVLQRLPVRAHGRGRRSAAVRVTTDPRCPACADGRMVYGPPGAWTCACGESP